MEHEAEQTRLKFHDEVKRVDAQRREINSKYQEVDYKLSKQLELHGDFDLINKENQALNNINKGLEKQIELMRKELVTVQVKHDTALDEI